MSDRRVRPIEYRDAQRRARLRVEEVSRDTAQRMQLALDEWARDVGRRLRETVDLLERERLILVQVAIYEASNELLRVVTTAIGSKRTVLFEEVERIWRTAATAAAKAEIPAPPLTMLGAYENLGEVPWRTLITRHVANAAGEVRSIITRGITRQVDPDALARAIVPYMQGAETFYDAFGAFNAPTQRILQVQSGPLRDAARKMNFNARRIAFTELHNARQEAEVQHFAIDPLVSAVAWRLSPYRGPTARIPDICDVLATEDFYGLGKGVYPIDAVPVPPHPHDRCERVPIVRKWAERGAPKPMGMPRSLAPMDVVVPDVTEHRGDAIRKQLAEVFAVTDDPDVRLAAQRLANVSTTVD